MRNPHWGYLAGTLWGCWSQLEEAEKVKSGHAKSRLRRAKYSQLAYPAPPPSHSSYVASSAAAAGGVTRCRMPAWFVPPA
ncbi:hypothetical protein E2C01_023575 [Portunus trituberculatus]|uniref:Uncharacterized protein n=1 Tax=Portunus trituberculatus TaxID=210409 RepID=A0A5B7EBY2_PORTR|nr:hypothetical protein [Portunus trituberculatus]